jgi:hypothetical protein
VATRNFWIDAEIDGRKTTIASGPRSRDGGFDLSISMRDEGAVIRPLRVIGWCGSDGVLHLEVNSNGTVIKEITTQR